MARLNYAGMAALIERAKKDPKFFHALIWDTKDAVKDLDFLSSEERKSISSFDPEDLVAALATGQLRDVGPLANCGGSCGVSCGGSCGGSCGISCGGSCGTSCAASELRTPDFQSVVLTADEMAKFRQAIGNDLQFSRFTR